MIPRWKCTSCGRLVNVAFLFSLAYWRCVFTGRMCRCEPWPARGLWL